MASVDKAVRLNGKAAAQGARDIGRGKFDFEVVGHCARPDVFQLSVNKAPMAPVSVTCDPPQ